MRTIFAFFLAFVLCGLAISAVAEPAAPLCPSRPLPGATVTDPAQLFSQNGVLKVDLTMRNSDDGTGNQRYCFVYQPGVEAPTLRVNPGDVLSLQLTNRLDLPGELHSHRMPVSNPCASATMGADSTNVHFHGLNVPPICHQDDVLRTMINPTDPPFRYSIRIPANEPPGLYWYHPHPHGFTQVQVMGGASGAIIVEGIEKLKPEVAGLTQRVLIVRDQLLPGGGDPDASNLTLNFVGTAHPANLEMQAGKKEFWRFLNASAENFLTLQFKVTDVPQDMKVISLDGTPLKTDALVKRILLPPAGRAEFIVQAPPAGAQATIYSGGLNTGPDGDPDPAVTLASITLTSDTSAPKPKARAVPNLVGPRRFSDLNKQTANTQRSLYFSEDLTDPDNPIFFLTVDGQTPKKFDPNDPPAIITQQGAVEDWTMENRSGEVHAFHIHQIHFQLLERNGVPVPTPTVQDTVSLPAWDKVSPTYPSIKVRMDFRYRESVGTFVYHCHILDHEDGGMMAKIQVNPK